MNSHKEKIISDNSEINNTAFENDPRVGRENTENSIIQRQTCANISSNDITSDPHYPILGSSDKQEMHIDSESNFTECIPCGSRANCTHKHCMPKLSELIIMDVDLYPCLEFMKSYDPKTMQCRTTKESFVEACKPKIHTETKSFIDCKERHSPVNCIGENKTFGYASSSTSSSSDPKTYERRSYEESSIAYDNRSFVNNEDVEAEILDRTVFINKSYEEYPKNAVNKTNISITDDTTNKFSQNRNSEYTVSPFDTNTEMTSISSQEILTVDEGQTSLGLQKWRSSNNFSARQSSEDSYHQQNNIRSYGRQNSTNSCSPINNNVSYTQQTSASSDSRQSRICETDRKSNSNSILRRGILKQTSTGSYARQDSVVSFAKQNSTESYSRRISTDSYARQSSSGSCARESNAGSYTRQSSKGPYSRQSSTASFNRQRRHSFYEYCPDDDVYDEEPGCNDWTLFTMPDHVRHQVC